MQYLLTKQELDALRDAKPEAKKINAAIALVDGYGGEVVDLMITGLRGIPRIAEHRDQLVALAERLSEHGKQFEEKLKAILGGPEVAG